MFNKARSKEMSLLAINVGKADCLLLQSGNSAYLVDTGTKKTADKVLETLKAFGVGRLDGIFLTHTHEDHTGGLKKIIESGLPAAAVYTPAFYTLKKDDDKHPIEKALKKTEIKAVSLKAGDKLPLEGGSILVLGPVEKSDSDNNNSLVLLAEGGGGTVLLTGDMEFPEEQTLLKAGIPKRVSVLKVANHGESDATSEALLEAAAPSLAVISTSSKEEPDTPSPRVMKRLEKYRVPVVQTQDSKTGVLIKIQDGKIVTEKI